MGGVGAREDGRGSVDGPRSARGGVCQPVHRATASSSAASAFDDEHPGAAETRQSGVQTLGREAGRRRPLRYSGGKPPVLVDPHKRREAHGQLDGREIGARDDREDGGVVVHFFGDLIIRSQ